MTSRCNSPDLKGSTGYLTPDDTQVCIATLRSITFLATKLTNQVQTI